MKLLLLVFMFVLSAKAYAISGGSEIGNGGDLCELRVQNIRDDIAVWIAKNGSSELHLPAGLSLQDYNQKMLKQISNAIVSCTEDKLFVGSAEKTCKNFENQEGRPRVVCNVDRFMKNEDSDQYILIHHEYAGLAGFEKNLTEESDYSISKQLSGYLANEVVKKLVIQKKKTATLSEDVSVFFGFKGMEFSDSEIQRNIQNLAVYRKGRAMGNFSFVYTNGIGIQFSAETGEVNGLFLYGYYDSLLDYPIYRGRLPFGINFGESRGKALKKMPLTLKKTWRTLDGKSIAVDNFAKGGIVMSLTYDENLTVNSVSIGFE